MYIIKKTDHKIERMNDSAWENANVANVACRNWREFEYIPHTTAKILYSDYGIHVQMESEEKPILARYRHQNTPVCTDSCMEFFISPNENDTHYFNFEINPIGTMCLGCCNSRYDVVKPDENKVYFDVKTYVDDKTWKIQYTIPFEFINKYVGGYTKNMRGNLYKCGNDTKQCHYLSYYPMHATERDFHRPEYFGSFILE
ncbi:MAG: carbohydrate-binding family 9-like protein [Clostridia bacterium]|nr:carbohydrate-binding family 9-like protein [Clostridia bacterium]